jgi:hypothetical protein
MGPAETVTVVLLPISVFLQLLAAVPIWALATAAAPAAALTPESHCTPILPLFVSCFLQLRRAYLGAGYGSSSSSSSSDYEDNDSHCMPLVSCCIPFFLFSACCLNCTHAAAPCIPWSWLWQQFFLQQL